MDPTTIVKIASTAGIISTASFWSMNLTIDYLAFPSLLLGSAISPSSKPSPRFFVPSTSTPATPPRHLTRQWQEVFYRGHCWGPPSSIISGVSFLTAAWYSASKSNEQHLYVTAAVAAMSVMPWTLLVIFPVNDELNRRGSALEKDAGKEEAKGDGRDLVALMRTWVTYNDVRAGLAVVATALGVWATFQ